MVQVLVTSIYPPRAYLYRRGLGLLAKAGSLPTGLSLRNSEGCRERAEPLLHRTAVPLSKVWMELERQNVRRGTIWKEILNLQVHLLLVMILGARRHTNEATDPTGGESSFQVLYTDLVIDQSNHAWLVDVGSATWPEGTTEASEERELHASLVHDTANILNLPDYSLRGRRQREEENWLRKQIQTQVRSIWREELRLNKGIHDQLDSSEQPSEAGTRKIPTICRQLHNTTSFVEQARMLTESELELHHKGGFEELWLGWQSLLCNLATTDKAILDPMDAALAHWSHTRHLLENEFHKD
mmetsp:Transcript_21540/g.33700  ORF Transcript_21540/g.33700 Transcript_21540/m.33700 type:complete len:299 (+) Transcript_21540:675-1571(+)